jgi:penicillin-binding protein 1B
MARKRRKRAVSFKSLSRRLWRALRLRAVWIPLAVATAAIAGYLIYLDQLVTARFDGRRWDLPAHVYARPLELYAGLPLSANGLVAELKRLGYRATTVNVPERPGSFRRTGERIELVSRPFRFWDGEQAAQSVVARFGGAGLSELRAASGGPLPLLRLDPLLIGSVFPADGEDRIVLAPDEVPPLIPAALKAVEDRRFDSHPGVDVIAIFRALFVNVAAGELRQGGSTLTQQLVRSYFLSNERTFGRKIREALMALALEANYPKADILNAYINEIYLGQDGQRAIHGFGLASQFYFSKPVAELDAAEVATLVAIVRGPSYYDPRRHPERVRERRDMILKMLVEEGAIGRDEASSARGRALGIVLDSSAGATYFPAYLTLVKRELASRYRDGDLTSGGLRVFTSLDPLAQARAEAALANGLAALRRADQPELEGAVVVVNPQTAEVQAVVGGRRPGFEGYNRAVDAKRPIGSLIKPVVYLAALQSGRTLATRIDDEPIAVKLARGKTWKPQNYDRKVHGTVPLVRALAESMNLATVRLGMEVGVQNVVKLLGALGASETPAANPSLLLGALELSPLQVAQVYGTLASDGFRTPLRAVRSVQGVDGEPLSQFPLQTAQAAQASAVFQVNQALVQVFERGTGRAARARLPAALTVAGKTGTSDDLRDSWFAGFSGDLLVVVWVGYDDNRPAGLSGAAGALPIWTEIMRSLAVSAYQAVPPEGLEELIIDYETGLDATAGCGDPLRIAVPAGTEVMMLPGCGPSVDESGSDPAQWLKKLLGR